MADHPTIEGILEQVKEMLKPNEFTLMLKRFQNDPLWQRISECCELGNYELRFRETFCGLNFIYQRPVQCPYLDLYGRPLDFETKNGNKYRIYPCLREKKLFDMYFEDPEE